MKQFFAIALIVALAILSSCTNTRLDQKTAAIKKSNIEVVFNRHLEFNDLVRIKQGLSQKGISIDYKKLSFDNSGKLRSITFFVDCKDGFSGGTEAYNLTNQSQVGFYRDYTKDTSSPFGTRSI